MGVSTDKINTFRGDEVKQQQKRSLDKRMNLIIHENKPRTDFRVKIEHLLEEKLNMPGESRNVEN